MITVTAGCTSAAAINPRRLLQEQSFLTSYTEHATSLDIFLLLTNAGCSISKQSCCSTVLPAENELAVLPAMSSSV
jgi:hypothetical protein